MQTVEKIYTPQEYLALEEKAEFHSEYRDGEIIPMTGGSTNHNEIVTNLCTLKPILRKQGYRLYAGDVRLWISQFRLYTYPDVMLIRGEPVYHANRTDTIVNPCTLIEVLSTSTQDYDRTTKFKFYRSIPELQEYVLIDQYQPSVEQFSKTDAGWLFQEHESANATLTLTSLGVELPISDLYEGVDFSAPEQSL